MGRIRTIKPETPKSESFGNVSRDARLLFILLWTEVDDAGRARASSRMLASLLYPYDEGVAPLLEDWMRELEREHMVERYIVDGAHYLQIQNWLQHQKIDKPSASRLPSPRDNSAKPREPSTTDLGPRTVDLGSGIKEEKNNLTVVPKATKRRTQLPDDFEPDETCKQAARDRRFTQTNWDDHLLNFKDYWKGVGKPMADWQATCRNSIRRFNIGGKINGNHQQHTIKDSAAIVIAAIEAKRAALGGRAGEREQDGGGDPEALPRLREGHA